MSTTQRKTEELKRVSYIRYSVIFKDQTKILLNSENEVNAMSQAFVHQLDLKIRKTNVGTQKIDDITLKTYELVVYIFSMSDKDGEERFFEEIFLLADVKSDVILEMLFQTMSNADVDLQTRDL